MEFIAAVTGMEFKSGCSPIMKLEGVSVDEITVSENCYSNIERNSTIYATAEQLGITDLNGRMRFKVTVERVA